MSVIVKGMEMPKSCAKCKLKYWMSANPYCFVIQSNLEWNQFSSGEWTGIDTRCPLGALPEKHGRLIDADALMDEAKQISGPYTGDGWDNWGVYALIDRQKTIVEATERSN